VIGCSREPSDFVASGYRHFCLDVADEQKVMELFAEVRRLYGRLDVLVNNAGIASMNHVVLTPAQTVRRIFDTNVTGRIINFSTVATPLQLEGEAIYAASKAAVNSLTQILARELAPWNITVNAVGPTPVQTDLIGAVPAGKIDALLKRQAIPRFGEFRDIVNVVDFFVSAESEFVTGQVLYLGGVS
jgi:3-oxoacyl-[acyl-carrier protein] reductase